MIERFKFLTNAITDACKSKHWMYSEAIASGTIKNSNLGEEAYLLAWIRYEEWKVLATMLGIKIGDKAVGSLTTEELAQAAAEAKATAEAIAAASAAPAKKTARKKPVETAAVA
jgi:hypothetical protein